MLPNAAAPTPGAPSVRPDKPWGIYMFRADRWVCVGSCGDRALAENHLRALKRMMRLSTFQLVWEGAGDDAT